MIEDYKKIQEDESAFSRGTAWGERLEETIDKYSCFFRGDLLDIGCNDGRGMERIQALGHVVTGIDIAEPKIKVAKEHSLNVYLGRIEKLPFKDKEFGTVFCSHTLEHAEDLEKAAAEIERVCGRAIIIVPIEETTENPGHPSPITSIEFLKELVGGKVIYEQSLIRMEKEHVLIVDYD